MLRKMVYIIGIVGLPIYLQKRESGIYTLSWNRRDEAGKMLSAGIYFVTLNTGNSTLPRKVVFIK